MQKMNLDVLSSSSVIQGRDFKIVNQGATATCDNRETISELLRAYLIKTGDSDILNMVRQEAMEAMRRQEILDYHKSKYTTRVITEKGRKPRYETYVWADGKRKPLRRETEKALEDAIVEFYSGKRTEDSTPIEEISKSLNDIYNDWRKNRIATKSTSTVSKDDWIWEQYYKQTAFALQEVKSLTPNSILQWLMEKTAEFSLTQRQFREMKSLLNSVLDYAVITNVLSTNPARAIHGISKDKFDDDEERTREEQIFEEASQKFFIECCWNSYKELNNVVYLGIVLNFMLGARVGELVAIKFADIDECNQTLILRRSEVAKLKDNGSGKMVSDGVKVVPYLKKGHTKRELPLSKTAIDVIHLIKEHYKKNSIKTEWLLTNNKGGRVTRIAVCNTIGRINRSHEELIARNNHCIRKTVITEMIQSTLFTQKEIQTYFGHRSYATTSKYYDFALNDTSKNAPKMDKALGNKLLNLEKIG